VKGGQSQRREVRGANGVEWGEGGVPSPLKKGPGEGVVPPPQKLKKNFDSTCSKNFCVQVKGGGASPSGPLNTPLDTSTDHRCHAQQNILSSRDFRLHCGCATANNPRSRKLPVQRSIYSPTLPKQNLP